MIFDQQFFLAQENGNDGLGSIIYVVFILFLVFGSALMKLAKFIRGTGKETPTNPVRKNSVPQKRPREPWEVDVSEADFEKIRKATQERVGRPIKKIVVTKQKNIPTPKKTAQILEKSPPITAFSHNSVVGTVLRTENSSALAEDARTEISASRDSLRKAFLMSEILGTPKGLREVVDPYEPL